MNKRRVEMIIAQWLSPSDAVALDRILSNDENGIPRTAQDNQLARQIAKKINSKGLGI